MTNEEIQKQRDKRKRVSRMKKMIVTTILTYMIVSIVVMVFLLYKVFSLQHQIYILSGDYDFDNIVEDEYASAYDEEGESKLYTNDNSANLLEEGEIPMVYLTFDDGPSANTEKILDILADYKVKGNFFVVGTKSSELRKMYKRIVEEGHTLGMHSYSHKYSQIYSSKEAFAQDLTMLQEYLYDLTGVWSRYYRFPGGSSNTTSKVNMNELLEYLDEQDIEYFDWNVVSGDATGSYVSADRIYENCISKLDKFDNIYILMHDAQAKKSTVEALPRVIETLQSIDGVRIMQIDENSTPVQHKTLD